ncbi:DUF4333 domain-containing protein [Glycomyces harbinensis]|uniref:DUF4333 domain-containing protein n=1 Tax=Glycomyces harbinensis TaxID=58114 RepID=UPI0015A518B1|nr:DUF4333 domain-containing protein [Glycomyces harbinensis]
MPIRNAAVLPLAFAVIGLSACSFGSEPTVSGADLSEAAADALEGEIGERPEVDCGDEAIEVAEGKEVECLVTVASTGSEFDATVTFNGVNGDEWDFDVQVASEPNNAPSEAPSTDPADAQSSAPADDGGTIQVTAEEFSKAVADALVEQWGSLPEIDCRTDVSMYAGAIHYCELVDGADRYTITITIDSVVGNQFYFTAELADTPN